MARICSRAHLVMPGNTSQNKSYKALVREHSIPSFTDLGSLKGTVECLPQGISFDGSVIVGCNRYNEGPQNRDILGPQDRAFRWTVEKGMESLGTLNGESGSVAHGVNNDGSVIVGEAEDGALQNQKRAFRWTPKQWMESVEKLLADKKVLPLGWVLTIANAVTPSGTVLIGSGIYKENKTLKRAWRAVIPRNNLF